MTYIVTGGTGLVGSRIVEDLASEGEPIQDHVILR